MMTIKVKIPLQLAITFNHVQKAKTHLRSMEELLREDIEKYVSLYGEEFYQVLGLMNAIGIERCEGGYYIAGDLSDEYVRLATLMEGDPPKSQGSSDEDNS